MGGNVDIVARLQLRAEQFSSETGARFAELRTRARSAAQDIRSDFNSAFAEVQKTAAEALTLPRTAGGSLNLGSQITELKTLASAADQSAIAQRELANAFIAASAASGVDAERLRLDADAAAVSSLAHEQNAAAIRQRIVALEAVQAELNKTTSQTRQLTEAEMQAARAGAGGFVMVGQQLQDFTVQVMSGQRVGTAFAQQIGQLGYGLSLMEGGLGTVGRFLVGPWGTALTIGAVIAGPLLDKLLDTSKAADELKKSLDKAAESADSFGNAEAMLGKVIDLQTGKLKTHNSVLLETVRLQAQVALNDANKRIKDANPPKPLELKAPTGVSVYGVGGSGDIDAAITAEKQVAAQQAAVDKIKASLLTAVNADALAKKDPGAYSKGISDAIETATSKIDKLAVGGKVAGKNMEDVKLAILGIGQAAQDKASALMMLSVLDGGPVPSELKPYKTQKKGPKARDFTAANDSAAEEIMRINAAWDDQPRLIDRALVDTLKLDNLIKELGKRKVVTPEVERLIALAKQAREAIVEGMDKPFRDFVERQRESLAVGELLARGQDVQADAMRSALQLQQALGRALRDDELVTVMKLAEQHERIARAIDDQRRMIGLYTGAVSNAQRAFDQFLTDLEGDTGRAFANFGNNLVGSFNQLRNSILSDQLFGGLQRDMEDFLKAQSGGSRTLKDQLSDQIGDAGVTFRKDIGDAGAAVTDFATAVRNATQSIYGAPLGSPMSPFTMPETGAIPDLVTDLKNDIEKMLSGGDGVITVVATRAAVAASRAGAANDNHPSAVTAFEFMGEKLVTRLSGLLGVQMPEKLAKSIGGTLGHVLQGVSYGQLGGSVFASITGGKDNKLASSIGGVLGEGLGKMAGPAIGKAVGGVLGKALGSVASSVAGPLGAIAGGILGNVIGGLFNKPKWSDSSLTLNPYGQVGGTTGQGRGAAEIAAATSEANSIASSLNSIVQQLGATVTSLAPITLGTWDGKYRVALGNTSEPLHAKSSLGRAGLIKDFGADQDAAIKYAIAYELSHAVIQGISEASKRILASGQDINSALTKVMAIESIPKDLKAMLDPVGAAIDDLNRKWKTTVNALKEGGATSEQFTQAQRLYDLQLQQVKNSTASASQTLKDFLTNLGIGSNSPLSLRDQEVTAKANLQPFLDQIAAGQAVDQQKYQTAAQAFLDVERNLYGSGSQYFDAFNSIRDATNKAIASIDNVTPVSPAVESPFAKATADATKATADLTADSNDLLRRLIAQNEELMGMLGSGGSDFINRSYG